MSHVFSLPINPYIKLLLRNPNPEQGQIETRRQHRDGEFMNDWENVSVEEEIPGQTVLIDGSPLAWPVYLRIIKTLGADQATLEDSRPQLA